MFNRVDRPTEILDVMQVFLNFCKLVIPLNVKHREVQIFKVMNLPLDVLEHVMLVHRLIYRTN